MLLNNIFYGQTMEIEMIRLKLENVKKDEDEEVIEKQTKLTFNGIDKLYTIYDIFKFRQNEVLMGRQIYLGFVLLESSKVRLYENYSDKSQTCFGEKNVKLLYTDTDSFILGVNTKDSFKDLQNLKDLFDFSNLNKNREYSEMKTQKTGKFEKKLSKKSG